MTTKDLLETVMRFLLPASALALALATVSSVSVGQKPDAQIDKRSEALTMQGQALLDQSKLIEAVDVLETALAVDPKNRKAIQLLARAAVKQDLPGKAVRLYRESLLIEPNDVSVLEEQGAVLVQKGALSKARENLAKIDRICATNCAEQTRLAAVIDKAATQPVISAEAIQAKPVVTKN